MNANFTKSVGIQNDPVRSALGTHEVSVSNVRFGGVVEILVDSDWLSLCDSEIGESGQSQLKICTVMKVGPCTLCPPVCPRSSVPLLTARSVSVFVQS